MVGPPTAGRPWLEADEFHALARYLVDYLGTAPVFDQLRSSVQQPDGAAKRLGFVGRPQSLKHGVDGGLERQCVKHPPPAPPQ